MNLLWIDSDTNTTILVNRVDEPRLDGFSKPVDHVLGALLQSEEHIQVVAYTKAGTEIDVRTRFRSDREIACQDLILFLTQIGRIKPAELVTHD